MIVTAETHLLASEKKQKTNWPDETNWPVGTKIVWNRVEPMTMCSHRVRFVMIAPPGEDPTCRVCKIELEALRLAAKKREVR